MPDVSPAEETQIIFSLMGELAFRMIGVLRSLVELVRLPLRQVAAGLLGHDLPKHLQQILVRKGLANKTIYLWYAHNRPGLRLAESAG